MTKTVLVVIYGALITLAACTSGTSVHQPVIQTNFHWSDDILEKRVQCAYMIKHAELEPTEDIWFLCMHIQGATL